MTAATRRAFVGGRILTMDPLHSAAEVVVIEAVYRSMAQTGSLPISVLMMPHAQAILTGVSAERLDGPGTATSGSALAR